MRAWVFFIGLRVAYLFACALFFGGIGAAIFWAVHDPYWLSISVAVLSPGFAYTAAMLLVGIFMAGPMLLLVNRRSSPDR